ncbi:hypothetical protein [Saccharopolyspora phatthalungensis]|uniref:Uncharacterized protein n=1 Tax=Saccharopolyspora phatthalungensis TaxID=664693 RepID=A0A840Q8T8_9PSEU|nr:hypothetical protein [Saccharopolyspora phatthalungensis]MBB5155098.1 hypothetical protein [Saccharopolyspora phatthalungensis]
MADRRRRPGLDHRPTRAAGDVLVVPLVLGAVYALLRWAEPQMPPWLTRILLGSNTPPTYPPTE